jgi:hypothetical protein
MDPDADSFIVKEMIGQRCLRVRSWLRLRDISFRMRRLSTIPRLAMLQAETKLKPSQPLMQEPEDCLSLSSLLLQKPSLTELMTTRRTCDL